MSMENTYNSMSSTTLSIHNRVLFLVSYGLVQVPGLIAVIMMFKWTLVDRGGFSWGAADPGKAFNWHPLLMTIGMIYAYGNGALIYRVVPPVDQKMKTLLKLIHATTMGAVFILMVVALKAAFDSHDLKVPPIPNMYTLHSWVGLTAAILFGLQWVSGLLVFMFPVAGAKLRSNLLPFHQYYGSAIFALAVAAALLGLLEKAIWAIKDYNTKTGEGLLVNFMGLMIIAYACGVTFLLSKFDKSR